MGHTTSLAKAHPVILAFLDDGTILLHQSVSEAVAKHEAVDAENGDVVFYRDDGTYLQPVFAPPKWPKVFGGLASDTYHLEPQPAANEYPLWVALLDHPLVEPRWHIQSAVDLRRHLASKGVETDPPPNNSETVIAISEGSHGLGVSVLHALPGSIRTTTLGVISAPQGGTRFYDSHGRVHAVRELTPPRAISPVGRLLAHTVYNPWTVATYQYEEPSPYDLSELIDTLVRATELDDDIITQFKDSEDIIPKLRAATSFDDCVTVLRYSGHEPQPPQHLV